LVWRLAGGFALVSVYAFEPCGRQLLAVWSAGVGSLARPVLVLPASVTELVAGELCAALTTLSQAVWATYVHTASAAVDDEERSQREQERDGRDLILEALKVPNLPDEFGMLVVSYWTFYWYWRCIRHFGNRQRRLCLVNLTESCIIDCFTSEQFRRV
jgi:hypothetical protein